MPRMMQGPFLLDARLAADTVPVCDWPLCSVLLMNDSRYSWLILVPRLAGASEIFDLSPADRQVLWQEVTQAAESLKALTACRKINVGALGNVVAQLHVHVVAREAGDFAGNGPVWGQGTAVPYAHAARDHLVQRLRTELQRGVV
ncbi:MAG: HIT domain-containing protein [Alphaproteobacteria bacterium]|jgi:diadenosine tetraphosphate (Ap4A) HIT family hydrolase